MKQDRPLYVAVDSDILRGIAYFGFLEKEFGKVTIEMVNDHQVRNDFNYYERLFENVKNDKVRLLVVDAVFQESKHSSNLLGFMKDYCYFPNVNAVNYQEKAEKARELAYAYCSPYKYGGVEYSAPMKFVFIADINKNVPTNDTYIMAQATVEGCCVLTGNKKDFIFDKRQNCDNKDRLDGICRINKLFGYCEEVGDKVYTSKPITLVEINKKLKINGKFGILNQNDDKIKGRTIL